MNRPTTIRLMGVDIPVHYAPSPYEDEDDDVFGLWDANTMSISINNECSPVQERVTLLHELIHAIDDFLYMELSHQDVYALSQTIFQVMRDNPLLMSYIQGSSLPDSSAAVPSAAMPKRVKKRPASSSSALCRCRTSRG